MSGKPFFDTNVLIYAIAQDDPRGERAEALLSSGGVLSVQVLNEFASVARGKLRMSWKDVNAALDSFGVLCPSPVPITIDTHQSALKLAERYGYEIYDALIAAAALQSGSATVYSEDLQDGQVIQGKLAIRNPFK